MAEPLDVRALTLLDAALERPSGERAAWVKAEAGGDTALVVRTLALLGAGSGAANLLRTGGAGQGDADAPLPERIGAYRITGLIGQGGMGAVYRGERALGDFEHVVAIKLIRPGALSGALVERFERERQTLARLAHPGIARLFDGGGTAAGEPYFVMELVDHEPLDAWLAAHAPPRAERLALFLDICAAVGFAHQNLIVHRDLTPSNILVAADGRPKLIDFGIARPPAEANAPPPSKPSLAGLSLTPGFAAPERLAGAAATTLSDIYSLGVLFDRVMAPAGDPDRNAIVARATAADPAARYPSADVLADDVAAWRSGHLVAARRGGRTDAVAKFVRRHAASVGAAAAALLLLIAAFAATLLAERRAEAARAEAEARFEQTRAIAKTLLFDTYDEVSKVPGATSARARLAETGQIYLLSLAAQPGAPLDVRIEAGRGFIRLAKVVGTGGDAQQGKLEEGGKLLARAEAILAPLHRARPGDAAVTRAYAELLYEQTAAALYTENDPAKARRLAERIHRLLRPIAAGDAETARLYAGA